MSTERYRFYILLSVFSLLCIGCASNPPKPKTGDIAFRLTWTGPSDLDLHVKDPFGLHLWFLEPQSLSGGILDIDCNNNPDDMCKNPIENVFWPRGDAPGGTYQYWVELFQSYGKVTTVDYTLHVLLGETVVETQSGTLTLANRKAGPYQYRYQAKQ